MRKLTAWILAILMVFSLTTQVFAATVSVEADKQAVSAGEQVTVTVNQNQDLDGVIAIEYRVYYDPDLFELTGSELAKNHDLGKTISDAKGTFQVINYLDKTSEGVTIPAGTVATLTFTAKETVTQEQSAGFELVNAGVMDVNGDMIEDNTVENGTVSISVSPAEPEIQQYTVTLPSDDGYTITVAEGSVSPVNEGGSYSFTVTVDTENYEGTPVVKANGTELTAVDGVYTIGNITADQAVTVEGITLKVEESTTYTVTLPEGAGYTVTPAEGSASPVAEGGSYSFTVTVDTENYEGTPVVKANGTEVIPVDGVYTVADITEDQQITVEGIAQKVEQPNTYTVTLPEGAGYTVTPAEGSESPVAEGGSYSFTVTVDTENYEGTPVVRANSIPLPASGGVYTISNITQDQTVTVEGIQQQGLAADRVIYQNGSNGTQWPAGVPLYINTVTLKGLCVTDVSWDAGYENCTITLHKRTAADAQYSLSVAAVCTVGGPQQGMFVSSFSAAINGTTYNATPNFTYSGSLENGSADVEFTATVQSSTGTKNLRLVVEGASEPEPETYEVSLTQGEGYTIAATEGSASPVTEGGSYSFTVSVNEGYEGTPAVKANGAELTAVNGVYTIGNISADQTVTVEGITKIIRTYTVTLTEGTGYTIAAAEGSASPVNEGGSYSFTVTANNGYEGPTAVWANGTELTAADGVYTIGNITADQVVTVDGITVKANMYTVTASDDVTASRNETASVKVLVTGNSNAGITFYNDYDVTLSYDPAVLAYVSAEAAHSGAEITADADAGTVRVVGHGEAKPFTDAVVTVNFTALASGSHDVTITTAKIDNSGNAIALDAPEAAVADSATAVKVAYPVTLPDNFTGELSILPGGDYVFTAPNGYYEITVTVGGKEVTPEVNGLVYTLRGVNGEVVVTAVGKTYKVTRIGENVTVGGADTAQYGSDYSFTVAAESGYAVTNVSVQVGDAAVDYTISDGTYVISGSSITGDVTVTVTAQQQAANTTQITFEGVDASEVVGGLVQYAINGQDFTFELNEEEGYVYTVKLGEEVLKPVNGVYTIPGNLINGTALTLSISKAVYTFDPQVTVTQYIQLNETVMWLITATEGETVLAYGEGNTMFRSDKYNAYCWLVVSSETEEAVKQAAESTICAAAEDAVAAEIAYDHDVNQTGAVDINDAQLTYDMYQAKMYSGFDTVAMDKFLEADVNGDTIVNVEDAAAVVAQILK